MKSHHCHSWDDQTFSHYLNWCHRCHPWFGSVVFCDTPDYTKVAFNDYTNVACNDTVQNILILDWRCFNLLFNTEMTGKCVTICNFTILITNIFKLKQNIFKKLLNICYIRYQNLSLGPCHFPVRFSKYFNFTAGQIWTISISWNSFSTHLR